MPTFTDMITEARSRLNESKSILDGTTTETFNNDRTAAAIAAGRAEMAHDIAMAAFWLTKNRSNFSDRCQDIAQEASRLKEQADARWAILSRRAG